MAIETRQPVPSAGPPAPDRQAPADPPDRPRRVVGLATNPTAVAVVIWLLVLPAAVALPRLADLDPFGQRAWSLSLGMGFAGVAALLGAGLLWMRRRGAEPALPVLAGVSAGLLAAWVALTLRVALNGTPFGFGGLLGDAGRAAALANRFSVTVTSSDAWAVGLPSEYPPLYFWLVGRAAAVLDTPTWQLIDDAQVLVTSATVIAGFALWRRLVPPWVALVIVALVLVVFGDPRKAYEVITAAVFVPWVLATFGRPPRGRLHWAVAGAIGGLIVLTYQAWLVFGVLGLLALIVRTWRAAEDRRRYLLHLVGVAVVATVVASWYVVPLLHAMLTKPSESISDLFAPGSMQLDVLPFLAMTPLGVLQLVGLVGLVWLRRTTWWATPLLLLVAGTLLFRVLATLRFAATGHTTFLHYTSSLYSAVLVAAGVLVLVHAAPILAARAAAAPPPGLAAGAIALALTWVCYSFSGAWLPGTAQPTAHYAAEAHQEPLPGGGYPRYVRGVPRSAPPPFPAYAVRDSVERVLGPDEARRKITLSIDERLYAYLPWHGYLGTSRGASGSLSLWDERKAEIQRLTGVTDPAGFADATADTRFGPIDIFVLRRDGDRWTWLDQTFSPGQFDPARWVVDTNLPGDVVVAVRRA
jgi:Arabinofuranosyltransferase N terminal/Arabinofuranosyltransferase A C terminal